MSKYRKIHQRIRAEVTSQTRFILFPNQNRRNFKNIKNVFLNPGSQYKLILFNIKSARSKDQCVAEASENPSSESCIELPVTHKTKKKNNCSMN